MARVDFYRVLGVSRDASDDAIKKAYRKLVFQHHPDLNPDSTHAEPKIREINAAYEVVGDPEKRRSYDRLNWGMKRHGMKRPIQPSFSTRWSRSSSMKGERKCSRS